MRLFFPSGVRALDAAQACTASGAELTLLANANDALMKLLQEKELPAGTYGKTVAEPSVLCACTDL